LPLLEIHIIDLYSVTKVCRENIYVFLCKYMCVSEQVFRKFVSYSVARSHHEVIYTYKARETYPTPEVCVHISKQIKIRPRKSLDSVILKQMMVCWLVGWLIVWLVGWLAGCKQFGCTKYPQSCLLFNGWKLNLFFNTLL
jgi:hypothetical protein